MYSIGSDIRFKTTMLKSSLCDYGDVYLPVIGTINITGEGAYDAAKQGNERDKGVKLKLALQFLVVNLK